MLRSNLDTSEPIYALASGTLPSAVAVVRLSGDRSFEIAEAICGKSLSRERTARLLPLFDDERRLFDRALVITFVGPHSFTGQDVIEFQTHGSIAVVRALSERLSALGGRPAVAGEFAYRALLNQKASPAELENLGDVFLARETQDLSAIHSRRDASVEHAFVRLRDRVLTVQAILDTAVDFSEEYSEATRRSLSPIQESIRECSELVGRYRAFRDSPAAPRLVLAGRPNAGKSSLFNALLCRYRSIVCEEAGTTRDVVEEDVEIGGRRWKLVDTAGFRREATGPERQGIDLGQEALADARFWILVVDGCSRISHDAERVLLEKFGEIPHVVVFNKSDRDGWSIDPELGRKSAHAASAIRGDGIEGLWSEIHKRVESLLPPSSQVLPTRSQFGTLETVEQKLRKLLESVESGVGPEIAAEENREILARLEPSIGSVDVEDVLDRVFKEFCIGK